MAGRAAAALCVAALVAGALCVTSAPFAPSAEAGDAKVADSLLKSGRQAFAKGDFEGAVSFFKKAQEENPDLIEACWWKAASQEKAGDKASALASYREFVTCFDGKNASGATMSKEETRLKGLAEKAIEVLAAGEKEFKKLEDAYVASLLAFAKDTFVRDPGMSRKAVDAILAVRPDHDEARKLLEKLGGAPAAAGEAKPAPSKTGSGPAPGPFRDVKTWQDLLANETFGAKDHITYVDGVMVLDTKDGSAILPRDAIEVGSSFAYEMDVHVAQVYDRGWLSGLTFAGTGEGKSFLCAFVSQARVVVMKAEGTDGSQDVAIYEMAPLDTNAWHRLGVVVKGPAVDVWFDGKKVTSWREPSARDLTGDLGVFQQRCRTERRLFRAGKIE